MLIAHAFKKNEILKWIREFTVGKHSFLFDFQVYFEVDTQYMTNSA